MQGWGADNVVVGARTAFQAEGVGGGGRVVHDTGADGKPGKANRQGHRHDLAVEVIATAEGCGGQSLGIG